MQYFLKEKKERKKLIDPFLANISEGIKAGKYLRYIM